ncbi:hypothetical protein E2562_036058, partial [Oryza meyeriana var. granulata]
LKRTADSCRLRWLKYLRPGLYASSPPLAAVVSGLAADPPSPTPAPRVATRRLRPCCHSAQGILCPRWLCHSAQASGRAHLDAVSPTEEQHRPGIKRANFTELAIEKEKKGNGKGAEPTNPIQNRPKPLQHTQNLTLKGLLTYQGTPLV